MTTRTALAITTTLVLASCQQAPDRHVLWTGTGIPMSQTKTVSTHDSKRACEAARDKYVQGEVGVGGRKPDSTGTVWLVNGTVVSGYVCHPLGLNPG